MEKPDLASAYALKTPDDSRRLYAAWARDYDGDFVDASDYRLHLHVARAFAEAGGAGPVLDVGAGTGTCGVALAALGIGPIDGLDISAAMLGVARQKGVYRDLAEADLTGPVSLPHRYAGVVSSGTFTTGHVGPEAFDTLLALAEPGGLFALSINAQHFEAAGFAAKLAALSGRIADLRLPEVAIYGPRATGAHKDDVARIALFRKL